MYSKSEVHMRGCICWGFDNKHLQVSEMCLCFLQSGLKMLGLYIYTLIIGHKSCNILSILNKLKLLKELQIFVKNNVFLTKK